MRIGAVFPQTEIGADPAGVRAWARAVEEMGYTHILAYDHVLGAGTATRPGWQGPYSSESSFHEIFTLFGYLAGATERVGLVTGVVILPQRQTALVAKQAAEVDMLSGGRLRLGIGVGWNAVEYEGLNEDFHTRGARADEQIAVLRTLWTQPTVTFAGRWHHLNDAGINPLPVQRPIPIWVGGHSDAALRRAGALGDGWLPQTPPDERSRAQIERLREFQREAGRPADAVGIEARLTTTRVPEAEWSAFVENWESLGATYVSVNTMGGGLTGPDQHIAALRKAKDVLKV